jgi:RNA binding exosome subunit
MDASAVHEQITDQLIHELEDSKYQDFPMMNRIEGRIRTRQQLERYIQVLVHKLEHTKFRSATMFERVDRAMNLLERFDRQTAAS